jgi:succinate dehydrogenase hydrophobic anchor subunit
MRIFQLQRFSAIALLVFLTLHMIVLHYPPFHIDFDNVLDRLENPIWKAIDIAFLFVVLVHALTGMYMVLTDLERLSRYETVILWGAILIGAAAFLYGTQTIMAFEAP